MKTMLVMLATAVAAGLAQGCRDDAKPNPDVADVTDVVDDTDGAADADGDADADADADAADDAADADAEANGYTTTCSGGYLDPTTSLCWQDPAPGDWFHWDRAVAYCAGLSLAGHGPGAWRLPTIGELRSLVRGCPETETGGPCGVTDECLGDGCTNRSCDDGCSYLGGPGAGGAYWPAGLSGRWYYWSSSSYAGDSSRAWLLVFYRAYVFDRGKTFAADVRCVRRGP